MKNFKIYFVNMVLYFGDQVDSNSSTRGYESGALLLDHTVAQEEEGVIFSFCDTKLFLFWPQEKGRGRFASESRSTTKTGRETKTKGSHEVS